MEIGNGKGRTRAGEGTGVSLQSSESFSPESPVTYAETVECDSHQITRGSDTRTLRNRYH